MYYLYVYTQKMGFACHSRCLVHKTSDAHNNKKPGTKRTDITSNFIPYSTSPHNKTAQYHFETDQG